MPFLQKVQWKLYKDGLKFRISPKKAFSNIGKDVKLKKVLLLSKGKEFKISQISGEEVLEFTLKDFFDEFSLCMNIYNELDNKDGLLPSLNTILDNVKFVYKNNFKSVNLYNIELPEKYTSDQLISFLKISKCLI